MAVTSIRSLGSRAMRIETPRWVMVSDDGGLRPCSCKTPRRSDCRYAGPHAIPGPLVTPEFLLKALDRFEADRDHQIATVRARRLSIEIRRRKPRGGEMRRYVSQHGHRPAMTGDRPDVNGAGLIGPAGKQSEIGSRQIHFSANKRIVTSAIKIDKGHRPQQLVLSAECQDAAGIEAEVSLKVRFRNLNSGHQPVRHICESGKLGMPRCLHLDFCAFRQQGEIVACGKSGPFHDGIMHLSSLLPVVAGPVAPYRVGISGMQQLLQRGAAGTQHRHYDVLDGSWD